MAERLSEDLVAKQVSNHGDPPVAEKSQDKIIASQKKRFDREIEALREMSRKMLRKPSADAAAFGLNSWEFQVAKAVAIAGVKEGMEQGRIKPAEIDREARRNVRRVANSPEFRKWVKEAYEDPKKLEQFCSMSVEEVRKDFVDHMSRDVNRQTEGLGREGLGREGLGRKESGVSGTRREEIGMHRIKRESLEKKTQKLGVPVKEGL